MAADPLSDAKVIDSWQKNAEPWTRAVRAQEIASRRLVTDAAIVDAVMTTSPRSALDLGCGEGWLARALIERGVRVIGVDVVPGLIARAREATPGGDFRVASYEEIARGALDVRVNTVAANFSLIGAEAVDELIGAVPRLLEPGGALVIQTLHPAFNAGDRYESGWRAGSWTGFSDAFVDPPPWYFRTIEDWIGLLVRSRLRLDGIREPIHPETGKPASIVFTAGL
jgi:SAM-dependent methyltransferase